MRFTTTELGALEAKIASAADRALGIELETFDRLAAQVTAAVDPIKEAADALAALDVAAALAQLAVEQSYVRPEVDGSLDFVIEGGRHPVVEQALLADGGPFVANDCDLSALPQQGAGRICLLTGPNMAGKSTFLRQNALIAIMAQMGSFVPARRARIGVVDRLFSRVGAADDLARGRSTFMVEMVETAAILNQAGERSLVILDEIGRGTATFDGLSIAWATIEHLHAANRCRALFATHFHELTVLSTKLPRLFNSTVRVKEWQGEVVFLHEVVPGAADRSYGIQVAKLAGLPASVIERAKLVLAKLEAEDRASPRGFDDLPLFAAAPKPSAAPQIDDAVAQVVCRAGGDQSRRAVAARGAGGALPAQGKIHRQRLTKPLYSRATTGRRRWRVGGQFVAFICLVAGVGRRAGLSDAADHHHRPGGAGRRERQPRARGRPAPERGLGPAGHRREPRRRQSSDRRGAGRQGAAPTATC